MVYNGSVSQANRNRPQFSITMDATLRDRLQEFAKLRGMTLARLIEEMTSKQLASIEPSVWAELRRIQAVARGEMPPSEIPFSQRQPARKKARS